MSSKYVVDEVNQFLNDAITNGDIVGPLIELDADVDNMNEFRSNNSLSARDPWLGIQYEESFEVPVGIAADNTQGRFREDGLFLLHIVEFANSSSRSEIRTRGQDLQNLLRGATINGDIYIESMTSPNFDDSETLRFDAGYISATITVDFYRNLNL